MKRFASLTALLSIFLTLSITGALTGCGQKGDLFLPQADKPGIDAEATSDEEETESNTQS